MVCPREKWTAAAALSDCPYFNHCYCCRHGALPLDVADAEGGAAVGDEDAADDGAELVAPENVGVAAFVAAAASAAAIPAAEKSFPRFGTKSYGRTWTTLFLSSYCPVLSTSIARRTF